jgi:hypothetical protein
MTDLLLGEGKEGRVYRRCDQVVKIFNQGVISDEEGVRLSNLVKGLRAPFPEGIQFVKESDAWVARYPWFDSEPVHHLTEDEVSDYLTKIGQLQVIADNFKLSNLRRRGGQLVYIDVGRHIRAFNRSTFRDVCAKAYALLRGMGEDRLVSDFGSIREAGGVQAMQGFANFYQGIVRRIAELFWRDCPRPPPVDLAEDVTLLLKCCAMDAAYLERQAGHLVNRLSTPRRFKEVVLSIDTKVGMFLRQHSTGDLAAVRASAQRLVDQGVVDRVVEAPADLKEVVNVNSRWFGVSCAETHTASGVPVYPQLWAFEQVGTRYVLQADCDVLICRQDHSHDYLSEMVSVHGDSGVMGVGFNIQHALSTSAKPYAAPVGEYKPEVRLGLFDLNRLMGSLPWPNEVSGSRLLYGWYHSLHQAMKTRGWKCLRGGDPRTAFIHPLNSAKQSPGFLDNVRRRIESGFIPSAQHEKWDLVEDTILWSQPLPIHNLVVALSTNGADESLLMRCVASLAGQDDRDFGIVVLEDVIAPARTAEIVTLLNAFGLKSSVAGGLCEINTGTESPSFVLRLRSDEALMSAGAISLVKLAVQESRMTASACPCDSDALRGSAQFGVGKMYGGEIAEHRCHIPRCVVAGVKGLDAPALDGRPSCVALDAFAEIPAAGGNRRPSVMAGFVVWAEPKGSEER